MVVLAFGKTFTVSFLPKAVNVEVQCVVPSLGMCPVICYFVDLLLYFVVYLICWGANVVRGGSVVVVEVF